MQKVLVAAIGFQVLTAVILLFVPFGFDKRSSWGLDINDLILLLFFDAVAIGIGALMAFKLNRPVWGYLQLASPLIYMLVVVLLIWMG